MRAVIQRATSGEVRVDGTVVGRLAFDRLDESGARRESVASGVGGQDPAVSAGESGCEKRQGLVVLLGVQRGDGPEQVATVARKIAELRILDGELSAADAGAPILVISQFTLYGDTRKGRRPSWAHAAPGEEAEPLVDAVVADLRGRGLHVETGQFGAMMEVSLVNDGPFTVLVEA
nr:D-aminoacyl-tRNA deacylase [Schaalia odontolytica]